MANGVNLKLPPIWAALTTPGGMYRNRDPASQRIAISFQHNLEKLSQSVASSLLNDKFRIAYQDFLAHEDLSVSPQRLTYKDKMYDAAEWW